MKIKKKKQSNEEHYSTRQSSAKQCQAMQRRAMQSSAKRHKPKRTCTQQCEATQRGGDEAATGVVTVATQPPDRRTGQPGRFEAITYQSSK
eukprot:5798326-Pyramimonas_sp.AAC.1